LESPFVCFKKDFHLLHSNATISSDQPCWSRPPRFEHPGKPHPVGPFDRSPRPLPGALRRTGGGARGGAAGQRVPPPQAPGFKERGGGSSLNKRTQCDSGILGPAVIYASSFDFGYSPLFCFEMPHLGVWKALPHSC